MAHDPTSSRNSLGERVAAAVRAGAGVEALDARLAREKVRANVLGETRGPVQLGRYILVQRIGKGGMGVVYAAYDPELDRKVALKVLHPTAGDHRPRLLREAQALARLSHPNVVAVHDVGVFDRDVLRDQPTWLDTGSPTRTDEPALAAPDAAPWMFIAMELIHGDTLATWLRRTARSPDEILRVMTDAGRGLAAAHGHGLVHRDFKPDNVMIDHDGRVRVMDFGLAAAVDTTLESVTARENSAGASAESSSNAMLGGPAGTPAYMAPEQFLGLEVTAAADQFAFCVTFWEALHGNRPFVADSVPELCAAVLDGRIVRPSRSIAPAWLRPLLERGLATESSLRWPSMNALLAALDRGRRSGRRRRAYVAAGGLALTCLAGVGIRELEQRRRASECDRLGASIDEVWNDDARERVRAAVLATKLSYASATADRLAPWIDARAESWAHERTQACLDANVRELWEAETAERSQWCFEHRKAELDALVTELQHADASFVQGSVAAVATWVPLDRCRDTAELAAMQMPAPEHREEARAAGREVARAVALRAAGKYDEGLAVVRGAIARAEVIGYEPLIATAHVLEGSLLGHKGDTARAEEIVTTAYFQSARLGAWDTAANAANNLVSIVGVMLVRPEEGLAWARHGEMADSHSPSRGGLRDSMRKGQVAAILGAMGRYAEASALAEEQLALREVLLGSEHPDVAVTLHNLALLRTTMGEHADARALLERALAIRSAALGPDHPEVANTSDALGTVLLELGDHGGALARQERALAIRIAALGRTHPKVGTSLANLGAAREAAGDLAGAITSYEQALPLLEKTLGADHPTVAIACANLGKARIAAGDVANGRPLLERAVAIHERIEGMQLAEAEIAFDLAQLVVDEGDEGRVRARELAERALADHRAATRDAEARTVETWLAAHPGPAAAVDSASEPPR